MPRLSVGTLPVQVGWRNEKRKMLEIQFLPSSIVAGNTGLVYGKRGSAPSADINSNSWDFVLNPGSTDGENIGLTLPEAAWKNDIWIVSDTASQVVNVREINVADGA